MPPHERGWRHPSELAAAEATAIRADPGSRTVRIAALTAGTLGLLAVGVLAVLVTPQGSPGHQVAAEASLVVPGIGPIASASTINDVPATTALPHSLALATTAGSVPVGLTSVPARTTPPAAAPATVPTTIAAALAALATPLDDGFALVTAKAVEGYLLGDTLAVRLASGRQVAAEVVAVIGHTVVVAAATDLADEPAHEVADDPLDDDQLVTVMLSPPRTLPLGELASVAAPEGTAVVDADGDLVGLCTWAADGTTDLALVDPATRDHTDPGTTIPTTTPTTSAP